MSRSWTTRRSRRWALAAALAIVALPLTASEAHAAAGGLILTSSAKAGGKETPLRVSVRTRPRVQLRIAVNGRPEPALRRAGGLWVARAGADAGARPGVNRIRILATASGGRRQVVERTVTLPPGPLLAGAGRDRTAALGRPGLAGLPITLGGLASSPGASFAWRVVGKPKGARAALAAPADPSTELVADEPGVYELRLSVTKAGETSSDTLTVDVQPRDPPIGVRIDTASDDNYAIAIDGQAVSGTGTNGFGASWVVFRRATREIVAKGAVQATDTSPATSLAKVAADYGGGEYVVAISGQGIAPAGAKAYADVLAKFGGPQLSDADRAAWAARPLGFSLIGVPGAGVGTAFSAIPLTAGTGRRSRQAEQLAGYLQKNPATMLYGFAFGRFVPFKTESSSSLPVRSIQIGDATFSKSVASPGGPGFHVLALDPVSLKPVPDAPQLPAETLFYVNAADGMTGLAAWLTAMAARPERPLIVVQSFSSPAPNAQARDAVALKLEALGGTRSVFNALDGKRDYAFIGRPGGVMPVAESPGTTSPAPLEGMLAPTTSSAVEPLLTQAQAGTQGVNLDLLKVAYQAPQPFKEFATPGERGANTALAASLDFLDKTDVRANYAIASRSTDWTAKAGRALNLPFAQVQATCGCTEAQFNSVRSTLVNEMYDVAQVRKYIDALQAPLDSAVIKQYISLQKIGQEVIDALQPPPAANTLSNAFTLGSYIVKLGQAVPGSASAGFSGLSALFGLVAFLSQESGAPTLEPQLRAKVSELTTKILQSYDQARIASSTFALLAVSDAGKLRAVASKSTSDENWILPDDPGVSPTIEAAAKRTFYTALLPIGYKLWWVQGTDDPSTFRCSTPFSDKPYRYPWQGLSSNAWAIFGSAGGPRTYALATMDSNGKGDGPVQGLPAAMIDTLTGPAPPTGKGLGFSKFDLYNPAVFQPRVTEVNRDCHQQQGYFTITIRIFNQGKIRSTDGRIDCQGDGKCVVGGFERGDVVTLNAVRTFRDFHNWTTTGACHSQRDTPTCTLRITDNQTLQAEFYK